MSTEPGSAAPGPAPAGPAERIEQVDLGTKRLLAEIAQPGLEISRPSLCLGWTVGHILTHLARNADGLARSAVGAHRGEMVPMYDSAEARNRDIEAGASRPLPELVADVTRSAGALRDAWAAMTEADWARQMPHHQAGLVPMRRQPEMRLYEVLVHHVDLDWCYGPADWPAAFVAGILTGAAGELAGRLPDGIGVDVRATDTGLELTAGSGTAGRVAVTGPASALAAWLAGRPGAAWPALSVTGGDLPELAS
jgi:maleylpyruvate isomerase